MMVDKMMIDDMAKSAVGVDTQLVGIFSAPTPPRQPKTKARFCIYERKWIELNREIFRFQISNYITKQSVFWAFFFNLTASCGGDKSLV
jgi:hypothetical protein